MKSSSHTVVAYLRSLVSRQGMAEDDDCELLRRFAQTRDGDAFAMLMRRHGPMVLNLARRISDDEQLAEDVFQAAFLLLTRKAHTIRRPESLPCWLHGVARRLALQGRRERQRRQQREAQIQPSSPPSPLDELTVREFLSVLDEELHQLPETYRAPLILCCLEGLSREEAAKRLGCSADALKGRLERGRQRLRLRLEKRGLTLPVVLGGSLLIAGSTSPVPAALAQATLQAATRGANVSPAVAALIQEFLRTLFVAKVKVLGTVVIALALAGVGVGMMSLGPQAAKENAEPPAAANDKPMSANRRVDLYGDPLPKGAVMRLGTLQRRAVSAQLAVTADGQSIVSVRNGKYLTIWDAATGQRRQSLQVPSKIDTANESGDCCALSPDGRLMATSHIREGKVTLWDVQSGKVVRELVLDKADFLSNIAFSPDGKCLAANGRIGRGFGFGPAGNRAGDEQIQMLRVWQLSNGKEEFSTDVRHNWACDFFAFSRDGKLLIVSFSSKEKVTCCWDLAEKRLRWQRKEFGDASMLLTPGGKLFSQHQSITLDLSTGKPAKIDRHFPAIAPDCHAVFSPDGSTLLYSTNKGAVVWDMVHGRKLQTLAGAGEQFIFLPDGKSVVTNNGSLQRWDVATGKPQWSDTFALGHVGEVVAVAFSADGRRLASGSTDGSVRLWDARTGRPLHVWRGQEERTSAPAYAGVRALGISTDGRRVVSAGASERLKLWDAASAKEVRTIPLPPRKYRDREWNIYQVRFSSDNRWIIACFGAHARAWDYVDPPPNCAYGVAVWDAETAKLLETHASELAGAWASEWGVVAPDAQTLLTRADLLDVESAKKRAELPERCTHSGPAAFSFSGEGALVAGGSQKLTKEGIDSDGIRIWETATGKIVARLKTKSWIAQTAFPSDHRFLVVNDFFGIQVRDVCSGEVVAAFEMPESTRGGRIPSYAGCLTITRDGRRLATGHPDSTILVWDVPLPPSRTASLTAKELESLWASLANADAAKAWRAVWRLADAPQDALPFLRGRVKPCPTVSEDATQKLLADLDNDSFPRREAAMKRLKELGQQVEPALRAALGANPSLEQRRRIESILAALSETPEKPTSEELRQLRALIVLECIGTPEARRLLEAAVKGPPSARLTRQAQAALACLP